MLNADRLCAELGRIQPGAAPNWAENELGRARAEFGRDRPMTIRTGPGLANASGLAFPDTPVRKAPDAHDPPIAST